MPIPSFFEPYAINFREGDYAVFEIADTDGTEFFEIWYYGELYYVKGEPDPYIVAHEDGPALVTARNPQSGRNIYCLTAQASVTTTCFAISIRRNRLSTARCKNWRRRR